VPRRVATIWLSPPPFSTADDGLPQLAISLPDAGDQRRHREDLEPDHRLFRGQEAIDGERVCFVGHSDGVTAMELDRYEQ
jgi:hypothetical protein